MKTGQVNLFDRDWDVTELKGWSLGDGINIDFAPKNGGRDWNFKDMIFISEYFGTQDIAWDNVHTDGCETCGWGGRGGCEVSVFNITKNYPKLMEGK